MIKASEKINTDLLADTDLQNRIAGNHYWEIAPDNFTGDLVVYRLTENKMATKDRAGDYDVRFLCIAKTITGAATLSNLVKTALQDKEYRFLGAESGYTDDEAREGFIQLNYNFKIR